MIRAQMNDGGWCRGVVNAALFSVLMILAGCTFGSEGAGSPPGLGCSKDLHPTEVLIDLTPYSDGYFSPVESDDEGDDPPSDEFLVFNQPFAVKWHFAYDGFFGSGALVSHSYTTHIEIREDGELIWETDVDSDPIKLQDEGWDAVILGDGLPKGHYVVIVNLDPEGEVPECDDLVTVVNNQIEILLPVWGPNGPPQNPTPCQEAELPNCRD